MSASESEPDFVYLASASPRRRELLQQLGVPLRIVAADVDETRLPGEPGEDYVLRLAVLKANAGWERLEQDGRAPVLGADTCVLIGDQLLGKPLDQEQGLDMLLRLSGRRHTVLTGVAIRSGRGIARRLSRSEVTFRAIDAAQARLYWDTGEPRDKAGGYAIQGFGASFVQHLSGSFSGVMGLPLYETAELLSEARVPQWQRP